MVQRTGRAAGPQTLCLRISDGQERCTPFSQLAMPSCRSDNAVWDGLSIGLAAPHLSHCPNPRSFFGLSMSPRILRLVLVVVCTAGCGREGRLAAKNPKQPAGAPAATAGTTEPNVIAGQASANTAAGLDWPNWRGPQH